MQNDSMQSPATVKDAEPPNRGKDGTTHTCRLEDALGRSFWLKFTRAHKVEDIFVRDENGQWVHEVEPPTEA